MRGRTRAHIEMNSIQYQPIGTIHSPFDEPQNMPIQPVGALGISGMVVVDPEFQEGLQDLEDFSHIILLYHFHLSKGYAMKVKPFLDDNLRGLFATLAPRRPNPIGISVVRLERIEGNVLHVVNLDIVDGTPLLDIKPYVPDFTGSEDVKIGWLSKKKINAKRFRADDRFRS